MKTSITVDLGVSLATGGHFLGVFKVETAVPVGIMSAESGMGTLQATARAVAREAGYQLRDIERLIWCATVPRIGDAARMANLQRSLDKLADGVLVIDPTYLALPRWTRAICRSRGAAADDRRSMPAPRHHGCDESPPQEDATQGTRPARAVRPHMVRIRGMVPTVDFAGPPRAI